MQLFLNVYLKIFFMLTPFFVMTVFLAMTKNQEEAAKRKTVMRLTFAVVIIAFILFFFGKYIFSLFGVTLDAFRIGAGVLLFLSAVSLVQGAPTVQKQTENEDIVVVPLAIPVMVGPGTVGVLMVMSAELDAASTRIVASSALLCAILSACALLYLASAFERRLGQLRLTIISKLTGLILASIAAQMVFTGIRHFLR